MRLVFVRAFGQMRELILNIGFRLEIKAFLEKADFKSGAISSACGLKILKILKD
jgi:hypothetical protein